MECYRHAFSCLQKLITKQTKLVQKSEKKLNLVLGGYLARQKNLVSRLNELHRDVDMSRINYLCFSKLAAQEQKSGNAWCRSWVVLTMRLKDAKERMKKEKERHAALQKRYKTCGKNTETYPIYVAGEDKKAKISVRKKNSA